ncbi:hypothetical protein Tco_1328090 [Tanacetum coccineum]
MSQPANDKFSQHLINDEASNHKDASDTGVAPKQQQQVIPQTIAISNIKLLILKKEEYDIWAIEMKHYLEYIDNDVWKLLKREKEAKNILLMVIPKEHMRRFHRNWMMQKKSGKTIRTSLCAWSNLAMTMRTKPDVDTLSIDDLYNNLRVFEQEIQEDWDLLHEDLEQIDDLDIEEMDINWQIAMIAIQ